MLTDVPSSGRAPEKELLMRFLALMSIIFPSKLLVIL